MFAISAVIHKSEDSGNALHPEIAVSDSVSDNCPLPDQSGHTCIGNNEYMFYVNSHIDLN
jgi:hypothetical protein